MGGRAGSGMGYVSAYLKSKNYCLGVRHINVDGGKRHGQIVPE